MKTELLKLAIRCITSNCSKGSNVTKKIYKSYEIKKYYNRLMIQTYFW